METVSVTKGRRNYRAERKAAADFADAAMNNRLLPRREWLDMWAVIYDARLAQIRKAFSAGEKP